MLPGINGLIYVGSLSKTIDKSYSSDCWPPSRKTLILWQDWNGSRRYITKPFSPRVLLARVRTVLRRRETGAKDDSSDPFGRNADSSWRHEVTMGENVVDLTWSEFRILHYLARRPGWVYSRDQIIDAIRGHGYMVTDRAIDVQVVGLRKKLGDYGKFIETVNWLPFPWPHMTNAAKIFIPPGFLPT